MKNEIRRLREERALSQATLGTDLGVSRQTVNSLANGRYDPSLPLAFTIARYFGLPCGRHAGRIAPGPHSGCSPTARRQPSPAPP